MDWTALLTPSIGATGLLAVVVVMVLTGRLQPKASVDERLADKDKQIDTWHTAYERSLEIQAEQRTQLTAMVGANETATKVLQALPRAVDLAAGTEGVARELAPNSDG